MTIAYLEPTAEKAAPPEHYTLRLNTAKQPLTLGLIANSFPDATNFMDCMERALAELLPGATLKRYQKPTVEPVNDKTLNRIRTECDGVIAAWGH